MTDSHATYEYAPTQGDMVEYTLGPFDADLINQRRKDTNTPGNRVSAGEKYPMLVVRVWGGSPTHAVNGQVFLDGADTLWATSRSCGPSVGQYQPYLGSFFPAVEVQG